MGYKDIPKEQELPIMRTLKVTTTKRRRVRGKRKNTLKDTQAGSRTPPMTRKTKSTVKPHSRDLKSTMKPHSRNLKSTVKPHSGRNLRSTVKPYFARSHDHNTIG